MGLQVELRVADERVLRIPDPGGGFFDAAGDFDRLVVRRGPELELFSRIDPHGETRFSASRMPQLIAELGLLLTQATAGPERRGLIRLRAMAERCADEQGELVFIGD